MIRREFAIGQQMFRITVGHISLMVQAGSEIEAISSARRQLCADMPRLWDVIEDLGEERFCVERL
jgi:hypothetical protein